VISDCETYRIKSTASRFLTVVVLVISPLVSLGQLTAPTAGQSQPTQYTNGQPNDQIFVFCSPDVNGNPITGSLTATPTIPGPGFNFQWGLYDETNHTYPTFSTQNGVPTSTVSNLASGGYKVTITNNAGVSQSFVAWVYVSELEVDIDLALDPVNPGCEPFDINGTISATGFTYWDPVPPGSAPFIVDASTTVTVCFNANHTYVSDLGFVLIGPPGCGSPSFALYPHPQVVNPANGCCCNSGNNLNNLCFSTSNSNQLNMCGAATPLTGTFAMFNGSVAGSNYPPGGIANIYGCNAAEGGWAVQIYDCIGLDVGALTGASISFSNGTSTINYNSGAINSVINDNSCTPATASIYVVPITTPINPDPQQVPNTGTMTYQLGVNGSPVTLAPGTTSYTQTVDPIPDYDEWYYLEITDNFGCQAIDSVMFDFTGYADATINPVNANNVLCSGAAAVQLTAATPGGTWSGTGANASGMFDPSVAGNGIHTITYTIANPCGAMSTMNITVTDMEFTVVVNDPLCASGTGSATITPTSGVAPFTYSWATNPVQTTATAAGLAAGTYNVTVTSSDGCVLTESVTVNEPPLLQANAVMTVASDCGQANGAVQATANGGQVGAGYVYSWNSVPAQNSATAVGLLPGDYEVTVTDNNGCTATASATVTTTPGFSVTITSSVDALCNGSCTGSATALAGNGAVAPIAYSWSTVPIQNTASASGLCAGTYTVTATDDLGCQATASVDIAEPSVFTVLASAADQLVCIGGSTTLSATTSGGTGPVSGLAWTANPADPSLDATANQPVVSPTFNTTYSVVGTDANGCTSAPSTIQVQLRQPLSIQIVHPLAGPDTSICAGEMAVLDAVAAGGDGAYTYHLNTYPNPVTLPMTVQPNATTTYTFIVTDGCTTPPASAASTITVNPIPTVLFSVDEPSGCDQHTSIFTDLSTPPAQQWLWNFGDSASSSNTAIQQNAFHTFSGPGLYDISLTVTTASGCTNDTVFTELIEVFELPNAQFVPNPTSASIMNANIQFTDMSSGNITVWEYAFGDGETSAEQYPTHMYQDTGYYAVTLLVTTADGCMAQTRGNVRITPDFMFYIPNAFTPNGDGTNDTFRPYGEGMLWDTYEMRIFTRWGQQIFWSKNVDNAWNGTHNGTAVEAGVYVYRITVQDMNGREMPYSGEIHLVR
jgi:gliding motility-associated-like protein